MLLVHLFVQKILFIVEFCWFDQKSNVVVQNFQNFIENGKIAAISVIQFVYFSIKTRTLQFDTVSSRALETEKHSLYGESILIN